MDKHEVAIIGGGSLGRLLVEIIESLPQYRIAGFIDDSYPSEKSIFEYSIIGRLADLDTLPSMLLAMGVGEPKDRKLIYDSQVANGHKFPPLVHSSAFLSKYASVADGVIVGPNSSILNNSIVAEGSCILSHVNINQDVIVNKFCLIGAGSIIGNNATLGEGSHISMASRIHLGSKIEPWTYYVDSK
jgi:NDP-sugar pyrophosphorylase family protein